MTSRRTGAFRASLADRLAVRSRSDRNDAARASASEDVEALSDRLRQAERLLEARRQSIYATPWYLVIGPPGAGKSAWLSGLGLAYDEIRESDADAPTVTCDLLLYENAVVLDVAGRLVTQDLDPAADRMAWAGLVRLLLKRRPLLPLSGVLVMVPATVLADADRHGALAALRLRLTELSRTFGGRIPVYLVVTKLDAAPGCMAMLSALDDEETDQVWGVTFGKAKPGREAVRGGLDDLIQRITDQVILRQHHGLDERMAAAMWLLPRDMSRLAGGLAALGGSVTEAGSLILRGIYLSTHPGALHDADRSARAPFARSLFEEVILREAGLARSRQKRGIENWHHLIAAPLAALALAAGAAWAYGDRQDRYALAETTIEKVAAGISARPLSPVTDVDPAPVLPALSQLEWLAEGGAAPRLTIWPYRSGAVRTAAIAAYMQGLQWLLEPRLLLSLEYSIVVQGRSGPSAKAYAAVAADPSKSVPAVGEWFAGASYATLSSEGRAAFARQVEIMLRTAVRPLRVDAPMLAAVSAPAGGRS